MKLSAFEQKQIDQGNRDYKEGRGFSKDSLRFERYFHFIKKFDKFDVNSKILDVGCGTGPLEIHLDKYGFKNVEAIDFAQEGLNRAKSSAPRYNYAVGDVKELDRIYAGRSFDVIFCCQVLEHVPNDRLVLKHMWNLLKPDGLLIISTPFETFKRNELHCNFYSYKTWDEICNKLFNTTPLVNERFGENNIQLLMIVRKSGE